MTNIRGNFKHVSWLLVIALSACGDDDGRDPILGSNVNPVPGPPTVTQVTPLDDATNVTVDGPVVQATFNQPMAPITGAASFAVTCAAPCANPTGVTVTLNSAGTTATYTSASDLEPLTLYTATITAASSLATGLPLASPSVWNFTTGARPVVTAVAPANGATGVPINIARVTATFSQPVAPLTGGASFTVTCAAPCTNPGGAATLNSAGTIATFTFPSAIDLEPLTLYTGTVTGAARVASGSTMASPFVWTFRTGATADVTRPRVTSTAPVTTSPGPTTGVPANSAVSAVFTEDMTPATLTATSFTVVCTAPCVSPAGAVTYSVGTRTAIFTPTAVLATGATYTATITTVATDLADNALAGNQAPLPASSNYVWTFTTISAAPAAPISVFLTSPLAGGAACPSAGISAPFTVPSGLRMDPNTVNASTFTVTGPGLIPVIAGSVVLDAGTGRIATFTPLSDLNPGAVYTAEITGGANGVKDLAIPANALAADFIWSFTVSPPSGSCVQTVPLDSVAPYGTFGGSAGMTNTGIQTVVNGDIGTIATGTSMVTGFHDTAGDIYTEVVGANVGLVSGTIYTCTNSTTGPTSAAANPVACQIASDARLDAEAAYLALTALPGGPDPGAGNLANLVLAPGVYTAASGSFMIEGGDLTLDAQGDANAVFVFQMASSLRVGGPGIAFPQSITLVGGAQGKNIYWQVGTAATINAAGGGTMEGTIISQAGVTFSTVGNTIITTLNGRALSLGASVTMVDTVINVPAP